MGWQVSVIIYHTYPAQNTHKQSSPKLLPYSVDQPNIPHHPQPSLQSHQIRPIYTGSYTLHFFSLDRLPYRTADRIK